MQQIKDDVYDEVQEFDEEVMKNKLENLEADSFEVFKATKENMDIAKNRIGKKRIILNGSKRKTNRRK